MSKKNWRVKRPKIQAAATSLYFTGGGTVAFKAESGEDGKPAVPTFEGIAYTGAPMSPSGFGGQIVCELGGIEWAKDEKHPVLHIHEAPEVVGHTTKIKASKDGIHVEGVLSGNTEHAEKVRGPASRGFPWQMSIGATPTETSFLEAGEKATVNGREVTGPMTIAHKTKLSEVSFVPNGADDQTSATVQGSKGKGDPAMNHKQLLKFAKANGNIKAGKYSDADVDAMDEERAKAALKECMASDEPDGDEKAKAAAKAKAAEDDEKKAKAAADDDEDKKGEAKAKARRLAIAAEEDRVDSIRAAVSKAGITHIDRDGKRVNVMSAAIAEGWTADRTELELLRASRASAAAGTGGNGPHLHFASDPLKNEVMFEAALFQSLDYHYRLNDDAVFVDTTPSGATIRKIPQAFQAAAQKDFKGANARYSDQVQQSAHTLFKGRLSLQQFLTDMVRASGSNADFSFKSREGVESYLKEWERLDTQNKSGFRASGTGSMNISNILANVLNKFALQGYLFVEMAHAMISAVRSLPDFKPSKSINLLGDVIYKDLGPNGEIDQAVISDQAFANQIVPYARMITIPWTYIVNDDLSMLATVPMKLGQGAGLKINSVFWTLWASMMSGSVNGDDGNPFWRTTSLTTQAAKLAGTAYKPNKQSGAGTALSAAALNSARAMFENQIDPNGNPLGFDGMKPILLFGPSNWQTATALMQSPSIVYGGVAGTNLQPDKNVWQGSMTPVQSRYIENSQFGNSTTAFFVLFDPVALPVIETAYHNGIETPVVLTAGPDFQFDRLGISVRGSNAVGVAQQNFRGGVFSVGA